MRRLLPPRLENLNRDDTYGLTAGYWWRKRGESFEQRETMTGIQFVTDEEGRRVAVQCDLTKHRTLWEDFWDGLVSEARAKKTASLTSNTEPSGSGATPRS